MVQHASSLLWRAHPTILISYSRLFHKAFSIFGEFLSEEENLEYEKIHFGNCYQKARWKVKECKSQKDDVFRGALERYQTKKQTKSK